MPLHRSRRQGIAPAYIPPITDSDGGGIDRGGDNGRGAPEPNGSGAKGTNTGYKIGLGIAEAALV